MANSYESRPGTGAAPNDATNLDKASHITAAQKTFYINNTSKNFEALLTKRKKKLEPAVSPPLQFK